MLRGTRPSRQDEPCTRGASAAGFGAADRRTVAADMGTGVSERHSLHSVIGATPHARSALSHICQGADLTSHVLTTKRKNKTNPNEDKGTRGNVRRRRTCLCPRLCRRSRVCTTM